MRQELNGLDLRRSDQDESKLFGDSALRFLAQGERPRLAGLQQRRNDNGCHCQVLGVHRPQRMLADELQGVLLNLVIRRRRSAPTGRAFTRRNVPTAGRCAQLLRAPIATVGVGGRVEAPRSAALPTSRLKASQFSSDPVSRSTASR